MLLLAFLLVPVVFANVQERTINNYIVKIDGSTLRSVEPTGTSSRVLNLSGLGLQFFENNVFDNLTTVKNLNLGNNSLSSIPNGLFSKLKNLEHLSLADNNITKFKKSFEGLDHLKTLNISNNPLTIFESTDLFGLPKSSVVFTKGLSISTINAYVFEKEKVKPHKQKVDDDEEDDNDDEDVEITQSYFFINSIIQQSRRKQRYVENDINIKICINDNVLKMVELLKENETLPSDCRKAKLNGDPEDLRLPLENLGIAKFEKGWFRLDVDAPYLHIDLSGNAIVEVTRELLNDLPWIARRIDLSRNKIERLNRGIIENKFIDILILDSNRINEIEAGALANLPNLHGISLNDNLLTDTKFVATLPRIITKMSLKSNRITEITPGSFSRLHDLFLLHLDENLIQEVKSDSLHCLFKLSKIQLPNNHISNIEPGHFERSIVQDISNNFIEGIVLSVLTHMSDLLTFVTTTDQETSTDLSDGESGTKNAKRAMLKVPMLSLSNNARGGGKV